MMATPFAAVPSASLVVRREKRRRRKAAGASDAARRPRRGFKFSDKKEAETNEGPAEATPLKRKPGTPAKDNTFVFRVRKDEKEDVGSKHSLDAAAASAALRAKQEKAARAEMRRLVRQKKREEAEREALNEEEMKRKTLSADQVSLYHMVQRQVKRELRKVRKEFLNSAARRDVMQLSETSLQAMKQELISFMAEHPPGNVAIKISNPENARMRATIDSYEQRIASLEDEETKWLDMKASLVADRSVALGENDENDVNDENSPATKVATEDPKPAEAEANDTEEQEKLSCELKVTQSVEALQHSALRQLGSTTQQLTLLDASMLTVDRLIVEAEMKKAQLFGAYHESAFKGYSNLTQPKESLRALLRLPARGGVQ